MNIKDLFFGVIIIILIYCFIVFVLEIIFQKQISKMMERLCKYYETMNKNQEKLQEYELKEFEHKCMSKYKNKKEANNG